MNHVIRHSSLENKNLSSKPKFLRLKVTHHMSGASAALFILGAAMFLCADLGRFPLVMWDESRLAVNALEMSLAGLDIVTTYNFAPDLWSTKPPLQIWLMATALQVIPEAEIALRVPSALAALGAVILASIFTWRVTRSSLAALLAGVLLIASKGFYGTHVARTGDYDALLVFFTTAYLFMLFFLVHRARPEMIAIVLAGLCIAAAVLTKNIAGLMPGVGVAAYLTLTRRWKRVLTNPAYILGALIAVVPVATFYAVREMAAPGYLGAVIFNEIYRFGVDFDTNSGTQSPFYYVKMITFQFGFSLGPLLLLVPVGWFLAKPRQRAAIFYTAVISAAFIAVISFGKTRYFWYAACVYPWLAIACAIAIHAGVAAVSEGRLTLLPVGLSRLAMPVLVLGMLVLVAYSTLNRHSRMIGVYSHESLYGSMFQKMVNDGFTKVTVVDPGRDNAGPVANEHYNPILRFYKLLYETRSHMSIEVIYELPEEAAQGQVIASCNPAVDLSRLQKAQRIATVNGCSAIRFAAPSS